MDPKVHILYVLMEELQAAGNVHLMGKAIQFLHPDPETLSDVAMKFLVEMGTVAITATFKPVPQMVEVVQ